MAESSQQDSSRRSERATWRPFVGQILDITGGAFEPEITEYRDNTGDVGDRSLENLLKWAASKGIVLPAYVLVIPYPRDVTLMHRGRRVPAKYFTFRPKSRGDRIYWNNWEDPTASVFSRDFNAVVVNTDASVLDRDEEFLHVLAHEVYEISRLKEYLAPREAGLLAVEVYSLIEPLPTLKNLHWEAWDYADSVIKRLRGKS